MEIKVDLSFRLMVMDCRCCRTFPNRSERVLGGAYDLAAEDIPHGVLNHLALLVPVVTSEL